MLNFGDIHKCWGKIWRVAWRCLPCANNAIKKNVKSTTTTRKAEINDRHSNIIVLPRQIERYFFLLSLLRHRLSTHSLRITASYPRIFTIKWWCIPFFFLSFFLRICGTISIFEAYTQFDGFSKSSDVYASVTHLDMIKMMHLLRCHLSTY